MASSSSHTSVHENIYADLYKPAVITAASFTVVALILSLFLILRHLRSYNKPSEQIWVVAVVFMVPVYATDSMISLLNPKLSLACDILRSCYEAFALYSFGSYLVACLGGERRVVELLENQSGKILNKALVEGEDENCRKPHWSLRNFFRRPTIIGKNLLIIVKFGLVQYMILKTVCAFLALVLEIFGVYGDGEFKFQYGYPYITIVLNFSQMWALYCLVQFYNVTHERLQPIRPLAKFISFKAIVFATWWQGVGIALLCYFGVLPNQEKLQTGLQDFLICIEMAIAAVAHVFVFSAEPYHYIPSSSGYEKITTTETTSEEAVKLEEGDSSTQAVVETKETQVEAPGTSVTESVQDIVFEGGHHVVKDVVLTINQAIGPVEKGVTKIQETFHQRSDEHDDKSKVSVEESIEVTLSDEETHLDR
ncbi:protein LAZ1 homolog 2 isoform X1 [Rosa chinensis]|uniref:protein LAZ1 homolog 2 isoform X1 n=2 Tax=Rosa chinensis TaxID=74649 RepID=UPI000D08944A|nr:protein LAZ1 homolog 2 isoform X1 [Rosa chinensis]XP_040371583.1 protein LAZ1 homolog 2 isoform X1 [Rosa chinensis]